MAYKLKCPSMFCRVFCASLLLLLISACSLDLRERGSIYYKTDFTWDEAQSHMDARTFYSDAKTNDKENLGLGLVMVLKDSSTKRGHYNLGACTAFLLDSTTLVTNAHCVPKRIRDREISCKDRIRFAHSASSSNFNCVSLTFAHSAFTSEDGVESAGVNGYYEPDIAILEIEAVHNVKYFTQATKEEGLKSKTDNEELFISSVDPYDSNSRIVYEGKYSLNKLFKIVDAEVTRNTYRLLNALAGAYFIKGNSGSPVHDSNYIVKAVGFAGHRTRTEEAVVLDFTCLEKTAQGWTWDEACEVRTNYAQ